MYILGISGYSHESSACLIKDGVVLTLIEEERINREKHTWKYPKNAIEKCLELARIDIDDIDVITFFWNPRIETTGNIKHIARYFPKSINILRAASGGAEMSALERMRAMRNIGNDIRKQFSLKRSPKIFFIEHHMAHAASAFFVSPYERSAILTIDGRGESTSTMLAVGEKNKIKKIKEIKVPHSLGHLYAAITDYLGFMPFFDEWKVMGMSAYGKDTFVKGFYDLVNLLDDGGYRLNLQYFSFHTHGSSKWLSEEFVKRFGPKRTKDTEYDQRHFDIAFALQRLIERTGVHIANHLYVVAGSPNLCMTGGVTLNCLMNKKIIEQTPFKNFFIQPVANDAGTSMGSALYYYHHILGKPRDFVFKDPYLGPSFSNEEIENVLKAKGVLYHKSNDIAQEAARDIAENKIVGWFQGRMEAGPRALGNRSITVSPLDAMMKDTLNARVKKREFFRPFAPSVLEEKVGEYFVMPKNQMSPYMILVGDVRKEKRNVIPAVTHADNTARVQTVNKGDNPLYHRLITEFEKLTGVAVLLNTSFNENEPIVCTPEDAINCFLRTEFDVLAIGDYLVTKETI